LSNYKILLESLFANAYLKKVNPFFSGACDFKKKKTNETGKEIKTGNRA